MKAFFAPETPVAVYLGTSTRILARAPSSLPLRVDMIKRKKVVGHSQTVKFDLCRYVHRKSQRIFHKAVALTPQQHPRYPPENSSLRPLQLKKVAFEEVLGRCWVLAFISYVP
jgi:hypothetical protein